MNTNGDAQREYNELKNCLLININTILSTMNLIKALSWYRIIIKRALEPPCTHHNEQVTFIIRQIRGFRQPRAHDNDMWKN